MVARILWHSIRSRIAIGCCVLLSSFFKNLLKFETNESISSVLAKLPVLCNAFVTVAQVTSDCTSSTLCGPNWSHFAKTLPCQDSLSSNGRRRNQLPTASLIKNIPKAP
jgi:hypothetical protein